MLPLVWQGGPTGEHVETKTAPSLCGLCFNLDPPTCPAVILGRLLPSADLEAHMINVAVFDVTE